MLREVMEVFEKKLMENDRLIIDSYNLKDGTYRLIEMGDKQWTVKKTLDVAYDRKEKKTIGMTDEDYLYIKELDYYSKLVEINKPIDQKKIIHSNNYLSIAVKKENVVSNKLTDQILKGYFQTLENPITKYEKKPKSKELYMSVEEQIGKVDVELLKKIEEYIKNNDIFEGIDLTKKEYIKVFFIFPDYRKTIDYFKKENERYLIPHLYNKNDYNLKINGEIIGLPNNNIVTNSKKPFLENKTRKVKVPYLLNQKDALLQSQLFDYLLSKVSQGEYNFYINTDEDDPNIKSYSDNDYNGPDNLMSGYYLRCRKEKNEVEIVQADTITAYSGKLNRPFVLKNYIGISSDEIDKSNVNYECLIDDLWKIRHLIDSLFFEGKLQFNFYSKIEDIQINDEVLKKCLIANRGILASWFFEGKKEKVETRITDFSLALIKNTIRGDDFFRNRRKAQNQLNLRWSLLEYLNNERSIGENMVTIKEKLRTHINLSENVEWDFDDEKEFAYAIGQIVSYFVSINKSNNKTDAMINPFLNARNIEIVKKKIGLLYKKYNYLMKRNKGNERVRQLIEHIMIYEEQKLNTEYVIAGFTAPSLVYEKNKEEEEDDE